MKIVNDSFTIGSNSRNQMINITDNVQDSIRKSGISKGTVLIFCPHTTGAITINENADPDVVHDVLLTLSDLIPQDKRGYRHNEGNSDAHVKSSLVGCSETVIINNGKMLLGTWQGIYFCEFDGPRHRTANIQITGE